jgi:dGTPase
MRSHGGFEGNGQTLRILSRLENFSKKHGSDLTRRSLLGVLKYPAAYSLVVNPDVTACMEEKPTSIRIIDRTKSKPPKCFLDSENDVVDWILNPLNESDRERFQSFERKKDKHYKTLHKSFDCSIMDVADDIVYGVHDLEDAIALGLGLVDKCAHPNPDGGDMDEAEITRHGFIVAGRQPSRVLEFIEAADQ